MTAITQIILIIGIILSVVSIYILVQKGNTKWHDLLIKISIIIILFGIACGLEDAITILNSLKSL